MSHLNSVDVTHCSVLLLWFQFLFQFLLDLFEFYFAHIIHWMFAIQKSDHSPVTEPVVKSCQASFCQVLVHADYSQDLPLILDFCDCQIVRSLMCAGTLEQAFSVLLLVISTLLHSKVNKRQESLNLQSYDPLSKAITCVLSLYKSVQTENSFSYFTGPCLCA